LPTSKEARRRLAMCRAIANLQRRWCGRFHVAFYAAGTVHPYTYVRRAEGQPLEAVRDYGKRSRGDRAQDVGALYLALEIIVHAWDDWARDPEKVEMVALGLERVCAGVTDAARAAEGLAQAVNELQRDPNVLPGDVQTLRRAIDAG